MLPMIIKEKNNHILFEYGPFFMDYDGRDSFSTFAIKLNDQPNLPDFASENEYLRIFKEPKNSSMDVRRLVAN